MIDASEIGKSTFLDHLKSISLKKKLAKALYSIIF